MSLFGPARWDVVNGSSGTGGGPRIEGLLRIGESSGEIVLVRMMFGDFSASGILAGDGIFDG